VKPSLPAEVIGCDGSFEIFYGVEEENYCALRRYSTRLETFMFGEAWCLFLHDRRVLGDMGRRAGNTSRYWSRGLV